MDNTCALFSFGVLKKKIEKRWPFLHYDDQIIFSMTTEHYSKDGKRSNQNVKV